MGWELATESQPVARKVYHCEASDWIDNCGFDESDYSPEDWAAIEKARAENWEIRTGTKHLKIQGKWEGEFSTFRARLELDAICHKYQIYQDM